MTTEDLTHLHWRKSSYSSLQANCVEVASAGPSVAARDSKDRDGGSILLTVETWTAFVRDVKAGRFDG